MKNTRGFTLIELMITIAILAIIVGIAVPAYQNQVEKTRRADAIAGLMQTAQQMERCFTRKNTYTTSDGTTPEECPSGTIDSPDGFYSIQISTPSATEFELTATPQGAQESDNDDCPEFTLDERGVKTPAPGSDSNRCWGSN